MDLLARIDHWADVCTGTRPRTSAETARLTYGELRAQSDALAAHLEERLGDNRAPIAVIGHKEPEMLIAFLGAVKSGRPYVPIDLSIPAQRAERIVQNAGAALTLTPALVREMLAAPASVRDAAPGRRRRPLLHHFHLRQHRGAKGRRHHAELPA